MKFGVILALRIILIPDNMTEVAGYSEIPGTINSEHDSTRIKPKSADPLAGKHTLENKLTSECLCRTISRT
jgi:hypothetical protein